MREYDLFISGHEEVSFAPKSEEAEIIQNVRNIIATPKYSAPMFREFGLEGNITDLPGNEAMSRIKSDIIMAVRKYEPRASVSYIDFVPDMNGKLSLRIRITI